jgi:cytochrome c oxidase subunit II
MRSAWRITALLALGVAGCASLDSNESVLSPAGPQTNRVANLFWLFCGVSFAVWLIVMLFFGFALAKRRQAATDQPMLRPDPRRERRMWTTVGGAMGATLIVLLVLLIAEFTTARATHLFGESVKDQVSIQITGHQWWWDVQYKDATANKSISTANELVIPVGKPVGIELNSADVIHSFWMPNLQGKKDLVPGHPSVIYLQADRVGMYWGECAEFCGFQHAKMRMVVKAVSQSDFDAWLAKNRQPAPPPTTASESRGQQVFMTSNCVLCHQISGTMAFGRIGPNLSGVGGRSILAAGAITNTHDNMAAWLADPQGIKPGTQMPKTNLSSQDVQALTDYLESLK